MREALRKHFHAIHTHIPLSHLTLLLGPTNSVRGALSSSHPPLFPALSPQCEEAGTPLCSPQPPARPTESAGPTCTGPSGPHRAPSPHRPLPIPSSPSAHPLTISSPSLHLHLPIPSPPSPHPLTAPSLSPHGPLPIPSRPPAHPLTAPSPPPHPLTSTCPSLHRHLPIPSAPHPHSAAGAGGAACLEGAAGPPASAACWGCASETPPRRSGEPSGVPRPPPLPSRPGSPARGAQRRSLGPGSAATPPAPAAVTAAASSGSPGLAGAAFPGGPVRGAAPRLAPAAPASPPGPPPAPAALSGRSRPGPRPRPGRARSAPRAGGTCAAGGAPRTVTARTVTARPSASAAAHTLHTLFLGGFLNPAPGPA